jgi:formylglycine-generating enzyme required for sulfatase activity
MGAGGIPKCLRRLPTETQWEVAARGGLEGVTYAWGNDVMPGGQGWPLRGMANSPWQHVCKGRNPCALLVGSCLPNRYGPYSMASNVWEWTDQRRASTSPPQRCSQAVLHPVHPGQPLWRRDGAALRPNAAART